MEYKILEELQKKATENGLGKIEHFALDFLERNDVGPTAYFHQKQKLKEKAKHNTGDYWTHENLPRKKGETEAEYNERFNEWFDPEYAHSIHPFDDYTDEMELENAKDNLSIFDAYFELYNGPMFDIDTGKQIDDPSGYTYRIQLPK